MIKNETVFIIWSFNFNSINIKVLMYFLYIFIKRGYFYLRKCLRKKAQSKIDQPKYITPFDRQKNYANVFMYLHIIININSIGSFLNGERIVSIF